MQRGGEDCGEKNWKVRAYTLKVCRWHGAFGVSSVHEGKRSQRRKRRKVRCVACPQRRWRRKEARRSSKTLKNWCNGGSTNCRTLEEEVLEKCDVDVSKRGVYKGRGEPSEWRMVQKVKKYQPRKLVEDCWARIFSWFRENDLQGKKGVQEIQTEKGGDKAVGKDEGHDR